MIHGGTRLNTGHGVRLAFVLMVIAVSGVHAARQAAVPADLVVTNAKVLTVDSTFSEAQAFAVRDGRFVAVGTTAAMRAHIAPSTKVIDGRGRTIIPGIIDTHVHALGVAGAEALQPFRNLRSVAELQAWISAAAKKRPAGTWIWSPRVYPPRLKELRFPTRKELDEAAPNHPVGVDGAYAISVNTAALRAAGITRDTPDPPGGAIVKDASGEPTGLLRNVGGLLARFRTDAAPVPPLDQLARVHDQYVATGITSVIERGASVEGHKAYDDLRKAGRLKVRSTITIRVPQAADAAAVERFVAGLPFRFGAGDEWLKVGPLKLTVDGGILLGTAFMREPYGLGARQLYSIDDPKYRGFLTLTPEQIAAAVAIGHKHGWQMVAHVTGDAGVDVVLDAFAAVQKQQPSADRRHTLIHAYFVHPETAARAAKLGVLVDTQPAWYYKDASPLATGLGRDRLTRFIGLRTLRQAGVDVAINTDHMFGLDRDEAVNPFNPFLTIYAATTRRTEAGDVIGPDEVVSRQDALRMMTSTAARFSFDEKDRGSIERGKLADFVVLDADVMSVPAERLKTIRPEMTVIGGRVVFEKPAVSAGGFPGETWTAAAPASQGLSQDGVDAAAAYALRHGGGSGCIIRHGVLVKEWGDGAVRADIKSATKGSVGTTLLGLAVDAGLLSLEDRARKHYPGVGSDDITIRQLATMTAGYDDARPPALVYKPGTRGIYSNDTSNMLAELLTIKFGEDLRTVLTARVMEPLGIRDDEWAWRANQYRARSVNDLASREFASGITITPRALARIGYLYLRGGMWDGRRILSKAFIREATRPTELPAPYDYYGFYWGTNGRGQFTGMPKDTFWALGLGDSFVVVSPSLDIVAVRLGVGSRKSILPGDEENWGARVEGFFKHVVGAARAPLPRSTAIPGIVWAPTATITRHAQGSDNWPLTWADDGDLYGAYGDGNGFEPRVPEKLSLGFARIAGLPPAHSGANVRSPSGERKGDGVKGQKASGMLMVDGVLYMFVRNAGNSQLAWSQDHGRTWTSSDWKFATSFGAPTFLNFGRNYSGARDDYVYVYSHDADSAYDAADRMVLARVPKQRLRDRGAYEFLKNAAGASPVWTANIAERGAVFTMPGQCYRSSVSYHAPSRRYLWSQTLPGTDARFTGGFAVYDAPEPWGPWTTVFYTEAWDVGPGETSSFPTKWMTADGSAVHLVFSGDDAFSVRRATLHRADVY